MPDEWDVSDDEIDAWLEEWRAVDQAAAEYLAERVPGVGDVLDEDDARWVAALGETISPSEEPDEDEVEAASAVMALQHADWLGLTLGSAESRTRLGTSYGGCYRLLCPYDIPRRAHSSAADRAETSPLE